MPWGCLTHARIVQLWQVLVDGPVEFEVLILDQQHHRKRCRKRFGERSEIIDGGQRGGHSRGSKRGKTICGVMDDLPLELNEQYSTGKHTVIDRLVHAAVDGTSWPHMSRGKTLLKFSKHVGFAHAVNTQHFHPSAFPSNKLHGRGRNPKRVRKQGDTACIGFPIHGWGGDAQPKRSIDNATDFITVGTRQGR